MMPFQIEQISLSGRAIAPQLEVNYQLSLALGSFPNSRNRTSNSSTCCCATSARWRFCSASYSGNR